MVVRDGGTGDFDFRAFAHDVKLTLQLILADVGVAADKNLFNVGLGSARNAPDRVGVYRGIAPAEHGETFFGGDSLQDAFRLEALPGFNRKENHPNAIDARRRQGESELGALLHEESVGNLDENPRPVARFRIAPACAAVRQVHQNLESLENNVVRLLSVDINDEADTAGVVFIPGVVKTPLDRETNIHVEAPSLKVGDSSILHRNCIVSQL